MNYKQIIFLNYLLVIYFSLGYVSKTHGQTIVTVLLLEKYRVVHFCFVIFHEKMGFMNESIKYFMYIYFIILIEFCKNLYDINIESLC